MAAVGSVLESVAHNPATRRVDPLCSLARKGHHFKTSLQGSQMAIFPGRNVWMALSLDIHEWPHDAAERGCSHVTELP